MASQTFKYQLVSIDTMNAQINLRLPEALLLKTKKYAQKQGFGNVQEFIKETIREKVFGEPEITPEGFELIKKLIEVSNKKNLWKTEEELFTMLRERRNGTHNKRK
ncbi:MAG: BrnA antitoxin family protein [Nanoarchaeota archaeon]|nr:BrnA antitoxin family protein [Nanoarchaeota archaeon]